jgi:hypothetical protein
MNTCTQILPLWAPPENPGINPGKCANRVHWTVLQLDHKLIRVKMTFPQPIQPTNSVGPGLVEAQFNSVGLWAQHNEVIQHNDNIWIQMLLFSTFQFEFGYEYEYEYYEYRYKMDISNSNSHSNTYSWKHNKYQFSLVDSFIIDQITL